MKTPRFEELATRWQGKAEVYIVYSEEAHPRAAASQPLNRFADQLASLDRDGDGVVTVAEYGTSSPRYMFDAFDVDHDGLVRSHELLAARRIDQFAAVEAPQTLDDRLALARRFRAEVPGTIPVLIDPIDNPTARAYGDLPNSAYVIGTDGRITQKLAWAAVTDVERELARLTGEPSPVVTPPDLALLRPHLGEKPLVVHFVAPGCTACDRMDATMAAPVVQSTLEPYTVVRLSVDQDDAWGLFEDLDLGATPAFVHVGADGTLGARAQGAQDEAAFVKFVAGG